MSLQETRTYTPKNLFAGTTMPAVVQEITVAQGQGKLPAGTVLGMVATSGAYKKVDKTKEDGTQHVAAILSADLDTGTTGSSTVIGSAYFTGEFNKTALNFGADTAADHAKDPRVNVSIFLKTAVSN